MKQPIDYTTFTKYQLESEIEILETRIYQNSQEIKRLEKANVKFNAELLKAKTAFETK